MSLEHVRMVHDILRKHLPSNIRVWVFGSRACWITKRYSDLDLALEGDCKLDYDVLYKLEYAFDEFDLPYKVDVIDLNRVSNGFRQIVDSHKIILLDANTSYDARHDTANTR